MDTIPERRMEMQPKRPTAAGRYEPWPHRGVWEEDCPGKLLLSSANRGWSDLSAELCTVRRGVVPWRTPQSDIRICIAVRSNETIVTRQAPGIESQIVAGRRTVWLSPPGLQEGSVDFAQDMPEFLHIYLPLSHFSSGNFDTDTDESAICALSYKTAFEDPLLAEIGYAVVSELKIETSAGGLLNGALASSLAARLLQKHVSASRAQLLPCRTHQGLDQRRLFRVLNYIDTNLEGDLSLERMATIACLSRYHFARAFRQAVGQNSPSLRQRQAPRAREILIDPRRPALGGHSAGAQLFQPGQFHASLQAGDGSGARSISSNAWIATIRVFSDGCQAIAFGFGLNLRIVGAPAESPATNDKTRARHAKPAARHSNILAVGGREETACYADTSVLCVGRKCPSRGAVCRRLVVSSPPAPSHYAPPPNERVNLRIRSDHKWLERVVFDTVHLGVPLAAEIEPEPHVAPGQDLARAGQRSPLDAFAAMAAAQVDLRRRLPATRWPDKETT
jgi:AraC family transcriptional regulator